MGKLRHCKRWTDIAAKPGMWALIIIEAIVVALACGYIIHNELQLCRDPAAARTRGGTWGYPAPTMPLMTGHWNYCRVHETEEGNAESCKIREDN